jgi:hypothetical protein
LPDEADALPVRRRYFGASQAGAIIAGEKSFVGLPMTAWCAHLILRK